MVAAINHGQYTVEDLVSVSATCKMLNSLAGIINGFIEYTRELDLNLRIKPRWRAYQKPRGKGMAEAFVKTFKCHYVYLSERLDAATVMAAC